MPTRKMLSEDDFVDLHGKVALVTGGNTGIGYATVQMLARKGAKALTQFEPCSMFNKLQVYIAARDEGRTAIAIEQLKAENINGGSFVKKEQRLDILVNNAARHISHFVLTDTPLPLMKATAEETGSDVRIVNVSSNMHSRMKPENFSTTDAFNRNYGESTMGYVDTYANSKLANISHIKALQKRLGSDSVPITCLAAHPGAVKTVGSDGFLASIPYLGGFLKDYVGPLFFGPWRKGAMTVAFAAASKEVVQQKEKYQGAYIVPIATIARASSFAQDERLQRELYATTESFLKELGL
ncbi:hypothetical protein C8R44DRAFT_980783 [Mycena epipterygia]|nr:hypothetical protein C8R44DRAFT_980783 [Mycena epipterygia]